MHHTFTVDDTEKLKHSLGPFARNYNEAQLRLMVRELDLAAEFLLDLYLARNGEEKRPKSATFDSLHSDPIA